MPKREKATTQAAPAEPDDVDDEADEQQQKTGAAAEGSEVGKVTDYAVEKEIDSTRASQAVLSLAADGPSEAEREAERARAKELAAVSIEQADVDLIVKEMELDKEAAELALREAKGDIVAALNTLVAA